MYSQPRSWFAVLCAALVLVAVCPDCLPAAHAAPPPPGHDCCKHSQRAPQGEENCPRSNQTFDVAQKSFVDRPVGAIFALLPETVPARPVAPLLSSIPGAVPLDVVSSNALLKNAVLRI